MKMKTKKNLLSLLTAGAFIFSAVSFTGEALAAGKKVTLNVESMGDSMMYTKKDLSVPADSVVTLNFKNNSSALMHNWILTVKGAADKVANEGIGAGEAKGYINKSNKNILAFTPVAKPGKTVKVVFKAPKKGVYDYVCTSPGHNMTMKGKFTVK
jgi:azurin